MLKLPLLLFLLSTVHLPLHSSMNILSESSIFWSDIHINTIDKKDRENISFIPEKLNYKSPSATVLEPQYIPFLNEDTNIHILFMKICPDMQGKVIESALFSFVTGAKTKNDLIQKIFDYALFNTHTYSFVKRSETIHRLIPFVSKKFHMTDLCLANQLQLHVQNPFLKFLAHCGKQYVCNFQENYLKAIEENNIEKVQYFTNKQISTYSYNNVTNQNHTIDIVTALQCKHVDIILLLLKSRYFCENILENLPEFNGLEESLEAIQNAFVGERFAYRNLEDQ